VARAGAKSAFAAGLLAFAHWIDRAFLSGGGEGPPQSDIN